MPAFQTFHQQISLPRTLLYGPEKSRKTWWAGTAAECGYNVLVLDADNGTDILTQLSPAAQERVYVLNISDTLNEATAAQFLGTFADGRPFFWDEVNKRIYNSMISSPSIHINFERQLNPGWVCVVDSWTAIVRSIGYQYARINQIPLSVMDEEGLDRRALYRQCGMFATNIFGQLCKLPCTVIFIGHQTVYEKHTQRLVNGRAQSVIEWSKTQIVSTSGPHAMSMGGVFTDILRFELAGTNFKINTTVKDDILGGARNIAPGTYDWDKFQFAHYAQLAAIPQPLEQPLPGETFVTHEPNVTMGAPAKPTNTPIASPAKPAPIVLGAPVGAG